MVCHIHYTTIFIDSPGLNQSFLKRAGFGACKSFDGYDTADIVFPEGLSLQNLKDCTFVEEKLNLILFGPVGTGKSHMAVAAGLAACRKGFRTRFFTLAALVRQLTEASEAGRLEKLLADLRALDLLILDEWGYVPIDRTGAQLLFQVITDSYEQKSVVITTNLEFSRWGAMLTDEQMTAAMIDRLVHHGHLITFQGSSYRMRNALMRRSTAASSAEESH